jgi:coiled-coil domain-containing protein 151
MRKEHDSLKTRSTRLRSELDLLIDQVKDLELESRRPHMEDNQYTRKIRALENKLDKAMIKYNEAQSIRKTYEQIVKRLKEERIGFDNQLQAIERTLGTKQRDYEELMLLAGDANHAREVALNELDRVRAGYQEERKLREKELRESHQMVQVRRQMLERMKQREQMRNQLTGQSGFGGDATAQQAMQNATANMIAKERIETRNKIDIFENAFRKIKEATGVSDVNEVIQKIVSQEGTTENLISLTRENASKIETLNEQKRRLKARVEEIKYSGVGGGHRRKMVDDHEDQLANSAARLERSRLKYERLSKGLIAMKAGVGHLQEKVESVREEVGGRKVELTDDSVAEVLRECELCLSNVLKRYKAALEEQKRLKMFTADSAAEDPDPESEMDLNSSRPFNQRIDLTLFEEDENVSYASEEVSMADVDDDELTRDKVKRASHQILLAVDRKKRKPKKKGTERAGASRTAQFDA